MAYQLDRVGLTRAAVRDAFAGRVERRVSPSTVYAVFDRTGILYHDGIGTVGGRTPTADTGYRIASCTKSFTAAALLILVERDLLSLDDPITAHVETGPLIGADGARVTPPTLGQLLSMSGGLPTDDPWADRQESISSDDFDRLVGAGIRFIADPGVRYEYSNLGYALAGRVISNASGRDYIDFVTEELISPLGLTGIGYDRSVVAPDGVADGYSDLDGSWQQLPFTGPGAFSPIGGIVASARALAGWAGWLNSGLADDHEIAVDHDQPLSVAGRRLMQTNWTKTGSDRQHYGLGLVLDDHRRHGRIVSHSGGYPGWGAHLRWHAESGVGIVAFENATYSRPAQPATAALELILDETIRPEVEPQLWPETAAARLSVERLLRGWNDQLAADLFADNVDLDQSLDRRRVQLAESAAEVDLDLGAAPVPLIDASPASRTPAELAWTVPGRRGSLRCKIQLTPQHPPRVQTLTVRPG